jgi:hypothetical protein
MGRVDTTAAETGGEASRSEICDTADWRPADSRDARESLILGMDLLALCVRENIAARLEDRRVADSRAMIADALVSAFKAHGRPSGSYVLPNVTVASEFGKTDDAWDALSRAYKEFAADHAYRCREKRLPRVYFVRYRGSRGSKAAFQLWVCTSDRMGGAAPLPPFVLDQPIRFAVDTDPVRALPAPSSANEGTGADEICEASPSPPSTQQQTDAPSRPASSGRPLSEVEGCAGDAPAHEDVSTATIRTNDASKEGQEGRTLDGIQSAPGDPAGSPRPPIRGTSDASEGRPAQPVTEQAAGTSSTSSEDRPPQEPSTVGPGVPRVNSTSVSSTVAAAPTPELTGGSTSTPGSKADLAQPARPADLRDIAIALLLEGRHRDKGPSWIWLIILWAIIWYIWPDDLRWPGSSVP